MPSRNARRMLSWLPVAGLIVQVEAEEPRPYQLERYESLWAAPLFASAEITEEVPFEPSTPEAAYRLLGMGTVNGIELAYIQALNGGPIEELSRNSQSGTTLLNVERAPDGNVTAVIFRKGASIHRAEFAALPAGSDPNASGSATIPRAEDVAEGSLSLDDVLEAAPNAPATLRTRLREASSAR